MRKWPSRPSMALIRSQIPQETASSGVVALRNLHISARWHEESGKGPAKPQPQAPRQDRVDRSRTAFGQLSSLNIQRVSSTPKGPVGLRGGAFRNGKDVSPGQPAGPKGAPPSGAVMARRRTPANPPARSSNPQARSNNPAAKVFRPGASRAGNRPNTPRRGPNKAGRGPRRRANEAEEMDEDADGSEELPDGLVRHLLQENEKHHGDKEYVPHAHTAAELLAWTESQLPPLAGTTPASVLSKHLDATVTHRAEYALTPTMDPIKQDVRRLISGHLIRFQDERIKKDALMLANAPKMQQARREEAEKLGLDPGASIEFSELPEALRRKTEQRVIAGKYEISQVEGKNQAEKTLQSALKALQANASYKPGNTARFLDAVEGLLEGKPRATAPKIGKT